MSIERGTRLGVYEITSSIGAGGMGEVYRARDTKLHRDVAVKVLPQAFGADPDRLARFEREAQTLAALNHPNIAQVHGVLEDPAALVMELVEGNDLDHRLARGALPVGEALSIARQIAEALEAAHERGIIHRDLKPANIKVRDDGVVKVLDFGLAKTMGPLEGAGSSAPLPARGYGATITSPAMTQMGVILGTAAYMAPEQARGAAVDTRADIWAFGAVLFEMLTGRRPFVGATVTDTLAAVLKTDPDWRALPDETPASIRRLLRRCLDRDVRTRLQAIGEARIVLADPDAADVDGSPAPRSGWSGARALPWTVAAVAIALAFGAAAWALQVRIASGTGARQVAYVDVSLPPDVESAASLEAGFNISPDGRSVLVTGVRQGTRRLHLRSLSTASSVEIGDSGGVTGSAFSPDGRSVAFLGNSGRVVTMSLADQQRATVARGADLAGGIAWGAPGLAFARDGALWLVPTDGGKERPLTELDAGRGEVLHGNPLVLPGGRVVLFSSLTSESGTERIEAVTIDGGARRVVLQRASTPVLSPTGHLLFARDGAVLATSFDVDSVTATGVAANVIPKGIVATTAAGGLAFRVSQSGDLLLLPSDYLTKRMESVARDGSSIPLAFPPARYLNPRRSPDGRRIMVETGGLRLDALDVERQTLSRLTPESPGTLFGIWNSDGRHIVVRRFNSPYWLSADGSGQQGRIAAGVWNDYPSGAGPDPDSFFSTRIGPDTAGDIVLMSRSGRFAPKPLIATPAYEGGAQLSPDGRWLAYVSAASGQAEIQVRRYPSLERTWQVSPGFGVQPRWRTDGREIFYRDGQNLTAVAFDGSKEEPGIAKPLALFRDDYDLGQGITIANYDVTSDGRFLMLRRDGRGNGLRLILNWTEELKRIIAHRDIR